MRKVRGERFNWECLVCGNNPRLLIHAGTHGDEHEVIEHVTQAIKKYRKVLPPFIFVPRVSPTAVSRKTRVNGYGHDMNRSFFSDSDDPEIRQNLEMIQGNQFELFVSFHEDPSLDQYYVYNIGYDGDRNELVWKHNQKLKSKGVPLLNGVDDPHDSSLGYLFTEGYNKLAFVPNQPDNGSISSWVFNRRLTHEYLLPEIPGAADPSTKSFIVETFFEDVILKMLQKRKDR